MHPGVYHQLPGGLAEARTRSMNFEFSEEQQFIREQARNFLTGECDKSVVRAVLDGDASFDRDLMWLNGEEQDVEANKRLQNCLQQVI